jgi:hypothetical protein
MGKTRRDSGPSSPSPLVGRVGVGRQSALKSPPPTPALPHKGGGRGHQEATFAASESCF